MPESFVIGDVGQFLRENAKAIAPQLHLILWGLGLLCIDPLVPSYRRRFGKRFWSLLVSLLGLGVASLHLFTYWTHGAGPAFSGMVTLDAFARYYDAIFLITAIITVLISYLYLDIEDEQHSEYYALILFATSGMMFMAGALDLVTIFIGLELMSVSVYVLVGSMRKSKRSNEAAMKYFLLGAFSTGIILYGMSLVYGVTGTTSLEGIGRALQGGEVSGLLVLSIFLMAAGLCFKIAAAPFHMWAPDAYEGAPTGITAYMSVAVKAAGFAIFFRIFHLAFADQREVYMVVLALIAMLTMTWGNLAAVTQNNMKRLLAYSSISHAGYVLMGLVAGSEFGISASAIYLLAYAFMNLGIWAVLILLRREDIPGEELDDFNGLFTKRPAIAILMLIFLLSLAGIPPLGGFIAKYFVFAAVIQQALVSEGSILFVLAVVAALNAVISLYYYLRIVVAMFIRTDAVAAPLSFSPGLVITLVITVLFTVLMGVYPEPFIRLAQTAALPLI